MADNSEQFTSPGTILVAERIKQGLSAQAVANTLKISLTKLESIERGDYRHVSTETYVRGYLRNYARLLGISEALIISSYESHSSDTKPLNDTAPNSEVDKTSSSSTYSGMTVLIIVVLLSVLAWLLVNDKMTFVGAKDADPVSATQESLSDSIESSAELFDQSTPLQEEDSIDNVSNETAVAVDEQAPELLVSRMTASELVNTLSAPSEEIEPVSPSTEATPVIDTQSDETPVNQPIAENNNQLTLSFKETCWVSISDASGNTLLSGLQPAGATATVLGDPPYALVLGHGRGVSIALNGESVDLPETQRTPLRFQVGIE